MSRADNRLDLRLSAKDKEQISRAAALHDVPVATFVRRAALRDADLLMRRPAEGREGGVAARLRGRATAGMSTDEIMALLRDE